MRGPNEGVGPKLVTAEITRIVEETGKRLMGTVVTPFYGHGPIKLSSSDSAVEIYNRLSTQGRRNGPLGGRKGLGDLPVRTRK